VSSSLLPIHTLCHVEVLQFFSYMECVHFSLKMISCAQFFGFYVSVIYIYMYIFYCCGDFSFCSKKILRTSWRTKIMVSLVRAHVNFFCTANEMYVVFNDIFVTFCCSYSLVIIFITHASDSRKSKAFIGVCVCACDFVYVCVFVCMIKRKQLNTMSRVQRL